LRSRALTCALSFGEMRSSSSVMFLMVAMSQALAIIWLS
jgi:hypothetical protein